MNPKLTDDQRQAIQDQGGEPVYVVDTENKATYVLVPADLYRRIRPLFESEEFSIRESYPLQEQVAAAEGWNEPAMNAYDRYDASRRST